MRPKWIAAAATAMSLFTTQAGASFERPLKKTLTLKRGDTLLELLQNQKIRPSEAAPAVEAFVPLLDLSSLKPSQKVDVSLGAKDRNGFRELRTVAITSPNKQVFVFKEKAGSFSGRAKDTALEKRAGAVRADFEVQTTPYDDGLRAGIPEEAISEMLRLLSFHMDIQRQIDQGDRFAALYEMKTVSDAAGNRKVPQIISFTLTPKAGEKVSIYRFRDENGKDGYYFDDGRGVERSMLQTPVEAKRISSRFGMRRHPIAGYTKMHKGVDFAAPTGTPVYASGDGTVEFTGRMSGYGKIVELKHDAGMGTKYAHLSRIAEGLTPGASVKQGQIIGYVGSTGSATGPHLHYEVLQNNVQINPLSVANAPTRRLTGLALDIFRSYKAQVGALYASDETVSTYALASSER